MASETFIDTSGFYALLVRRDERHAAARRLLDRARSRHEAFVTTDHVLDETTTLLKARGYGRFVRDLFHHLVTSHACRVEWTDSVRFQEAVEFCLKHEDQAWSFTDCLSFLVMRTLRLRRALTKDTHFRQAGFEALLSD